MINWLLGWHLLILCLVSYLPPISGFSCLIRIYYGINIWNTRDSPIISLDPYLLDTVWLVIFMGFKLSLILWSHLIQEKLLNFSYILPHDLSRYANNINLRNHLSYPNHENFNPQKLPTIQYACVMSAVFLCMKEGSILYRHN